MDSYEMMPENKKASIWFFNKQDQEEQKLIDQFYVKLKIEYKQIRQIEKMSKNGSINNGVDPSVYDEIEVLLREKVEIDQKPPKKTWRNAYYIEQMLALIFPIQKIDIELSRRIEEAKGTLPESKCTYYANQVVRELDSEQVQMSGDTDIDKKSLLIHLISDLQWHKEKQQVERSYGRTARLRTTIMFVFAFLIFFLPNIIPPFAHVLLDAAFGGSARIYFVFTAIAPGCLGAAFSLLISIRKRLEESNLDGVKVLYRYSYIVSRVVIGMGAGLVFYYFLQSGLINGDLLPTPFSGSALPEGGASTTLEYKDIALVIIFCFLSGFSETIVPNLLSRTEKQVGVREANQAGAVNEVVQG